MMIFHCYVSSPEGKPPNGSNAGALGWVAGPSWTQWCQRKTGKPCSASGRPASLGRMGGRWKEPQLPWDGYTQRIPKGGLSWPTHRWIGGFQEGASPMTQATRSLDILELRTSKYNQIYANMQFLVKQDLDGSCFVGNLCTHTWNICK